MKPALKPTSAKFQPKSSNKQKSGSYNLIKGSRIQLSLFCDLYQACNRDTNQIWHAKVINNEIIDQYGLGKCLQFNIEVLNNCKQFEYVIFLQQIFEKGNNTFIIQQKYDKTLAEAVNESYPIPSHQIEDILNEIVSGLLQLYKSAYAIRIIRPQNIVCVDGVWKIQSFVLNSQLYGIQSEYCWSPKFASPEDRRKEQQLSDRQIDQQLVWNIGILGLYMILGPNYQYQKIFKDNQIPWNDVKKKVSQSLYRFLVKALKVNFKDRMRLRQLLQNQIFANLNESSRLPFLTESKFFSQQSVRYKKQVKNVSLTQQEQKKMALLKNEIQRFIYFGEVERYVQELPQKSSFDSNLIRYLCFKISFENLSKLRNQILIWKNTSTAVKNNSALQQIETDLKMFINNMKQNKINYSKMLKGSQFSKSEVSSIKGQINIQINDEKIQYHDVISLYNRLAGSIYTIIAKQCQNKPNEQKQRTLCFYALGAYLINFYEIQKFNDRTIYQINGILSLVKLINEAPIKFLTTLSQKLIKQHFAVANQV